MVLKRSNLSKQDSLLVNTLYIAPRKQDNTTQRNRESWYKSIYWRLQSLPAPVQPQYQLPYGDSGWVYTSTNNVALQLTLKSWFLPVSLTLPWKEKLFLVKYCQNQYKFCKKFLFWSYPLGKKQSKTKTPKPKPNQRCSVGRKSARCQGKQLLLMSAVCLQAAKEETA